MIRLRSVLNDRNVPRFRRAVAVPFFVSGGGETAFCFHRRRGYREARISGVAGNSIVLISESLSS
jgi:hypothetical protein